jgi:hypothetical protein
MFKLHHVGTSYSQPTWVWINLKLLFMHVLVWKMIFIHVFVWKIYYNVWNMHVLPHSPVRVEPTTLGFRIFPLSLYVSTNNFDRRILTFLWSANWLWLLVKLSRGAWSSSGRELLNIFLLDLQHLWDTYMIFLVNLGHRPNARKFIHRSSICSHCYVVMYVPSLL